MNLVRKDYKAAHRTIPQYRLPVAKAVPREDAVAVSQQQTVRTQVATDGKETVFLPEPWVGERY